MIKYDNNGIISCTKKGVVCIMTNILDFNKFKETKSMQREENLDENKYLGKAYQTSIGDCTFTYGGAFLEELVLRLQNNRQEVIAVIEKVYDRAIFLFINAGPADEPNGFEAYIPKLEEMKKKIKPMINSIKELTDLVEVLTVKEELLFADFSTLVLTILSLTMSEEDLLHFEDKSLVGVNLPVEGFYALARRLSDVSTFDKPVDFDNRLQSDKVRKIFSFLKKGVLSNLPYLKTVHN